ncbi:MAG: hypothetical protein ACK5RL_13480 [Acidimicrobiales bacterium]
MPVAQQTRTPARQALLVGLAALLGVISLVFLITQAGRLVDSNLELDVDPNREYVAGDAEGLALAIGEQGPLLLPDLAGGDTDIWLQHLSTDPGQGWHAFVVRPPQASRDCVAEWQTGAEEFVDNCDGTVYPADGTGLPQLPVSVNEDGQVAVLLGNAPADDAGTGVDTDPPGAGPSETDSTTTTPMGEGGSSTETN